MKKTGLFILLLVSALALAGCGLGNFGAQTNQPAVNTNNANQNVPAENPTAAKYNNIFFGSSKYDPNNLNCYGVYWVHILGEGVNPIETNLNLLLAGPTDKWATGGYFSSIPAGTKLNSVKFADGVVTVDLSAEFNSAASDCAAKQAKSQITETAKYAASEHLGQEVKKVVITIDGE